jgi:hypothetical protein
LWNLKHTFIILTYIIINNRAGSHD